MITQHGQLDTAIQNVGNRYVATMLIAKRIRQLNHGARAHVERQEGEKNFSVAIREIAEGHIAIDLKTELPVSKSASASNGRKSSKKAPKTPAPTAEG